MSSGFDRKKVLGGVFWSFADSVGTRLVRFVVGLVLARLLAPEQFGVFGAAFFFVTLSNLLVESGFGQAIVQRNEPTREELSSILFLNIGIGLCMMLGLSCVAPLVANFYAQPELLGVVQGLSLVCFINAFGVVPNALLEKDLQFKTIAIVTSVAALVSGLAGVVLAFYGYGVWALIVQQIVISMLRCFGLWLLSSFRPKLAFSLRSISPYWKFGSNLLGAGFLNLVFESSYSVMIAKFIGMAELGLYTRAQTLQGFPSQVLSRTIVRVTFPVFSAYQGSKEALLPKVRLATRMLAFALFPLSAGLLVTAEPLVRIVLTDKWLAAVPLLQLLCVAGFLYPMHLVNLNVLKAIGRSDLFLRLEIIKKALVALNLLTVVLWGVEAMIVGQAIISFVAYFINTYYTGRLLGYGIKEQIKDIGIPALGSFGACLFVFLISGFYSIGLVWDLLFQAVIGFSAYFLLTYKWGLWYWMELKDAISFAKARS